jgi:hypothetical protein
MSIDHIDRALPPSAIVLGPSRRHQWHSVPLLTRDSNARTEAIVFDDTRVYSTHLKSPPVSRQKDCVEDADLATLWPGQLSSNAALLDVATPT